MRRLLALTLLQRGLAVAVYLVATMILARLLTPAQVGIYSLGAAVLAVASVVREFGITEFLMQDKSLDEGRIRAAFGVATAVAWTLGLVILLLRGPIAAFYGEPGLEPLLAVMCSTFLVLPLATPTTALLFREMRVATVLWIQTVAVIVGHVASVTLAFHGYSYMSLAWGNVVNTLCMLALLLWVRRDALRHLPTLRGSGPIWSYCSKYTASGLLEQSSANLHEFVIGRRFGFEALGLFSRANGLFVYFNQNIGRGVSRVLLPSFAQQARADASQLHGQYVKTIGLYTALVWPMYGLMAVLAPEIIRVLYGPQWAASAPLLRLLCLGAIVQAAYAFAGELLGGLGQPGARLRITGLTTPLWAALCLAASFISLPAVALALSVQSAIVLTLYVRQLRRLIGYSFGDLLRATRGSALLAACTIGTAALVRPTVLDLVGHPFPAGMVVGVVAGIVWCAVAFATRHAVAGEIRRALGAIQARVTR